MFFQQTIRKYAHSPLAAKQRQHLRGEMKQYSNPRLLITKKYAPQLSPLSVPKVFLKCVILVTYFCTQLKLKYLSNHVSKLYTWCLQNCIPALYDWNQYYNCSNTITFLLVRCLPGFDSSSPQTFFSLLGFKAG